MREELKKYLLLKHFKVTIGVCTFLIGGAAAYFLTPFTWPYISLMLSLAFMPTYYIASNHRDKLDRQDYWKGILASEAAREAPSPNFTDEEKLAAQFRAAYAPTNLQPQNPHTPAFKPKPTALRPRQH